MQSFQEQPTQKVINEIQYFIALSVLKKLWQQEEISLQVCEKANVALAEKYGVLECRIQ